MTTTPHLTTLVVLCSVLLHGKSLVLSTTTTRRCHLKRTTTKLECHHYCHNNEQRQQQHKESANFGPTTFHAAAASSTIQKSTRRRDLLVRTPVTIAAVAVVSFQNLLFLPPSPIWATTVDPKTGIRLPDPGEIEAAIPQDWTDVDNPFFDEEEDDDTGKSQRLLFARLDDTPDTNFYQDPRFVEHVDENAVQLMTDYISKVAIPSSSNTNADNNNNNYGVAVLDLCSSWVSHIDKDVVAAATTKVVVDRISGLGMNAKELQANPVLTDFVVQDLNTNPLLEKYSDKSFDVVLCQLSIDYLTRPLEVLKEVSRILKPGGTVHILFSNRLFLSKAVASWTGGDDIDHAYTVACYLHFSGGNFVNIQAKDLSTRRGRDKRIVGDPIEIGWARTRRCRDDYLPRVHELALTFIFYLVRYFNTIVTALALIFFGYSKSCKIKNMSSSSCKKCVKVLRDLISGLQENNNGDNVNVINDTNKSFSSSNNTDTSSESPPLTLLKAIAGAAAIPNQQKNLQVEEIEDGVRLTIPVETTLPALLRRWTKLPQPYKDEEENDDKGLLQPIFQAMATSANDSLLNEQNANNQRFKESTRPHSSPHPPDKPLTDPLTIELKCRKCASSGPEGGARAFLMGPQPLSVVLCHNRIASNKPEVEEILTHELVHLFDVQTLQLDLQDCENLAYSEVRAAKAAECRDSWKQLQPYCVKQKAISATNNLFPKEGRNCINRVFATAFADNRPFDGDRKGMYATNTNTDHKQSSNNSPTFTNGSSDK
ncbi:peptidase M76 family protein [Nitzschia inconspicua]|uniref:Peptidase M76 family protein n=1 Tax=Nitzschia inconspicua TaxID=303405 RepID=A0A9K3PZZ4_9STRA|nr:peptidase M76 family protein [Nitzschia inconspicua]